MTALSAPRRGSLGLGVVTLVILAVLLGAAMWWFHRKDVT